MQASLPYKDLRWVRPVALAAALGALGARYGLPSAYAWEVVVALLTVSGMLHAWYWRSAALTYRQAAEQLLAGTIEKAFKDANPELFKIDVRGTIAKDAMLDIEAAITELRKDDASKAG